MAEQSMNTDDISISELEGMLSGKKRQLQRLISKRERLQNDLDDVNAKIEAIHGGAAGSIPAGGKRARNEMNLPDTIEAVMKKEGVKSMRVPEIVKNVEAMGYRSTSANFRGIVNQTLIKDDRFKQVSRGQYGLSKK